MVKITSSGKNTDDVLLVFHSDVKHVISCRLAPAQLAQFWREIGSNQDRVIFYGDLSISWAHFKGYFVACAQAPSSLNTGFTSFKNLLAEPYVFNAGGRVEAVWHL